VANPHSSSPNGQEAYGWIYENTSTGQFSYTTPIVENLGSGTTINIGSPPSYAGFVFVGTFHTHPFDPSNPTMTDEFTNNHLSQSDESYATGSGAPIYVGVEDSTSPDGSASAERWYQYSPSTGKETLENFVGSGGC